ncbi:stage VI sporulation protein D [Pseudoneobacillus sp. C159]
MSQENQSFLRFSLEESVWFQRGQEVEELLSLSLDPNITIQESDQYVTIRGTLDLTGEYKTYSETDPDQQVPSAQRWVQRVEQREEGVCEFAHQFPVDITIPTYRVREISEIDVLIETFDYALLERSCLKLTAELNITGLYGEQSAKNDVEQEREEEQLEEIEVTQVYEFSHRNQPEEEEDTDFEVFEVEARMDEPAFPEPTLAESSSYQPMSPEISFAAYRSQHPHTTETAAPVQVTHVEVESATIATHHGEESSESSSSSSSNIVEKFVKKKLANKKSMSISEFLARKEGDDHAKMKVCIVQQGESAEMLAERYALPVQQLLKVNKMEPNQDVYEGQVLYVPASSKK